MSSEHSRIRSSSEGFAMAASAALTALERDIVGGADGGDARNEEICGKRKTRRLREPTCRRPHRRGDDLLERVIMSFILGIAREPPF